MRPPNAEVIEQAYDVVSHLDSKPSGLRYSGALPKAPDVERDHAVIERQRVGDAGPIVETAREAVDEHHGLSLANVTIAKADVARHEIPVGCRQERRRRGHRRWRRRNGRTRRACEG